MNSGTPRNPAPRGDTLLWISLIVFGLAAVLAGKIARPGPIAEAYVEVTPHVSVLVRERQAAKPTARTPPPLRTPATPHRTPTEAPLRRHASSGSSPTTLGSRTGASNPSRASRPSSGRADRRSTEAPRGPGSRRLASSSARSRAGRRPPRRRPR